MSTIVKLNANLIRSIGSVLRLPIADLIKATSIANTTWYRIMDNPSGISVQQLLSFANGLHIPVRRFFSCANTEYIGQREDYVTDPYLPCYYNDAALQEIVNNRPEATWKLAAKETGTTRSHLRDSLLAVTRTPVSRFLKVCHVFGIDPFTILVDPNCGEKRNRQKAPSDFYKLYTEISKLNKKVDTLADTINSMNDKYHALLERHNELESIVNGYFGYGAPLTAAEPEGED
jgi:hypothetical protein